MPFSKPLALQCYTVKLKPLTYFDGGGGGGGGGGLQTYCDVRYQTVLLNRVRL